MREKTLNKLCLSLALLLAVGGGLVGCKPVATPAPPTPTALPAPTETPGTAAVIDICDQNPLHPECIGPGEPTPTALPGVPETLQTFTDPLGRFTFDYPTGWHTMNATPDPADGVQVMDGPTPQEATRWVHLWVGMNPERASVPVWVAEKGLPWIGQVTAQEEDWINGVPVLRQRLENDDPNAGGPYVYALVWWPFGENILLWTAWPGEQPETLNLLERTMMGLRAHE